MKENTCLKIKEANYRYTRNNNVPILSKNIRVSQFLKIIVRNELICLKEIKDGIIVSDFPRNSTDKRLEKPKHLFVKNVYSSDGYGVYKLSYESSTLKNIYKKRQSIACC